MGDTDPWIPDDLPYKRVVGIYSQGTAFHDRHNHPRKDSLTQEESHHIQKA